MIKEVIIPEKVGTYYLFPQRILGFDIGKTHVCATQIYVKGNATTIEKFFEIALEPTSTNDLARQVSTAIKSIIDKADTCDAIHTSLSSSVVIFKELTLPFLQRNRIALTLNYELEPLLPFSLENASVDFIITNQNTELQQSTLLVAAVQNTHIEEHLKLFELAGVVPQKITVDVFALYSVYQQNPAYKTLTQGVALIDIGIYTTRIAYIYQGQLKAVRTLAKGVAQLTKTMSDTTQSSPKELLDYVMRFGLEGTPEQPAHQALTNTLTKFWHEIQFTLRAFAQNTDSVQLPLEKLLLLGGGSRIKGLAPFVQNLLTIPTEIFDTKGVTNTAHITLNDKAAMVNDRPISLGTALPWALTDEINFRQGKFATTSASLLQKQLLVAAGLLSFLFISLFAYTTYQKRKLSNELYNSEQEAIRALTTEFSEISGGKLVDVIDSAEEEIKKREAMWLAFSGQERSSFLKYLLELSNIDKDSLGLVIESIKITGRQSGAKGTITLKGRVRDMDFDALTNLEKELNKSPLFEPISPQEKTSFTIQISVKNDEGAK